MVLRDKQAKGHGLPSTLFVSVGNREILYRGYNTRLYRANEKANKKLLFKVWGFSPQNLTTTAKAHLLFPQPELRRGASLA